VLLGLFFLLILVDSLLGGPCSSMKSEKQLKAESIENDLRKKESESASRAHSQLEKDFRDKYGKQNDIVAKNFDIPKSEFVIDHYACAHYGKIPKQGRLFITPKFVLFFANLLGKKVKKKIPFDNIVEIKKETSTLYSVSPIEIQMKFKRFTFVSFLHRDKAYANLMLQWKSNKEGKPYAIKIPLEEEEEDEEGADEGEHASLSNNPAHEPESAAAVQVQSMWGSSQANAIINSEPQSSKGEFRILAKMPKLYSSGPEKKRSCSCFPCFPCFK